MKALLLFFSENNDYYLFVCDEFICTRYRGLIPVGDIFYYETPVNIHVISSYGEETFRSFLLYAYKKLFYTFTHYHVKRRESKTDTSKYTKSNFVFLETDYEEKIAIYHGSSLNDCRFFSELGFANLLYKDYRYRTDKHSK